MSRSRPAVTNFAQTVIGTKGRKTNGCVHTLCVTSPATSNSARIVIWKSGRTSAYNMELLLAYEEALLTFQKACALLQSVDVSLYGGIAFQLQSGQISVVAGVAEIVRKRLIHVLPDGLVALFEDVSPS